MQPSDFKQATDADRKMRVTRPYEQVPLTELVQGAESHLVTGQNAMLSFLTMKAGSVFPLHSHPEEQIMFVLDGYCDEIIDGKLYRLNKGDLVHLAPNIVHGAFLLDVDCVVIDIFSPPRKDYAAKAQAQHPGSDLKFA